MLLDDISPLHPRKRLARLIVAIPRILCCILDLFPKIVLSKSSAWNVFDCGEIDSLTTLGRVHGLVSNRTLKHGKLERWFCARGEQECLHACAISADSIRHDSCSVLENCNRRHMDGDESSAQSFGFQSQFFKRYVMV